jgi:hypothetical protein
MIFAFLPQHVWEVIAGVMAVLFLYQGLTFLIKGDGAPGAQGMSDSIIRVAACVMLLFGIGIGVAAFTVDAEQSGAHGGDGWGGTSGVVIVCGWVGLMCGGLVWKFIRGRHR